MDQLFQPFHIKNLKIKNRICFPPVVCYSAGREDGSVTEQHIEHYRNIAKGGTGLIIQEATCVDELGRLSRRQLGIWKDSQIEGLSAIVQAVHQEDCPIFIQIHHAGVAGVEKELLCPSNYRFQKNGGENAGREMTLTFWIFLMDSLVKMNRLHQKNFLFSHAFMRLRRLKGRYQYRYLQLTVL